MGQLIYYVILSGSPLSELSRLNNALSLGGLRTVAKTIYGLRSESLLTLVEICSSASPTVGRN